MTLEFGYSMAGVILYMDFCSSPQENFSSTTTTILTKLPGVWVKIYRGALIKPIDFLILIVLLAEPDRS